MGLSNYNGTAYISSENDRTALKTSASRSSKILEQCEVVTLETFLACNSINYIDVLKLDCEGAEYDIAQDNLCEVNQIVGEYHSIESKTPEQLKLYFLQQGFHLKQWSKSDSDTAGIFWLVNKRYN